MTIFWMLLAVFLTTGALLLLFNYRSRRLIERYILRPVAEIGDGQFCRSLTGLLGAPFYEGNTITHLKDGAEIFPAMVAAIQQAQKTITFESYLCSSGEVCSTILASLKERARAGVKVHVTLDWVGSVAFKQRNYLELRRAGVQVVYHRRLHWFNLTRLNNRSHRKILVIDGKVGFTGGVGIADQWLKPTDGLPPWRDNHYRIEGPVVAQMQTIFLDNWLKGHARVLEGEKYFPELQPVGERKIQVFKSSPVDGVETVRLMYLYGMACAKKSIQLLNAYFVPDLACIEALLQARRRGVEVEIIVPGVKTDQRLLQMVSKAGWGRLLRAGVKIYEYMPTMHHGKLFIVDDQFVSIGSANFDGRSFSLNDEMNLNVLDREFAVQEAQTFVEDKALCRAVTYEDWRSRSVIERMVGWLGKIIILQF